MLHGAALLKTKQALPAAGSGETVKHLTLDPLPINIEIGASAESADVCGAVLKVL